MAVAIPIALGALGASTAVSIGVGLAVAATGIGGKIDKAASKVFGKDLVKIGNIAGAAYMGYTAMGGQAAFGASSAAGAGRAAAAQPAFGVDAIANEIPGVVASAAPAAAPAALPGVNAGQTTIDAATRAVKPWWSNAGELLTKVGTKIDGMSEKQLGVLGQLGGNMLLGSAQGAAAAKAAEEERRFKEEQDARYRSGSGLTSYAPVGALAHARTPIYVPPWRG